MIRSELSPQGRLDIVIDAPPVNAFSTELLRALTDILRHVPPEARVVLLRAQGRGFSAGGDIKEMESMQGHQGIIRQVRDGLDACVAVESCPVPVIAAVHGYAIGIGALIAGVCDVIVAAEGTRFVLSEVDNGAASGAVQAIGLLPEKRVRAAMLTGAPFFVEEMKAYGSVQAVVPHSELVSCANEQADVICKKSPGVVRALKEALGRTFDHELIAKYRAEASYTYELHLTGEAKDTRALWWRSDPKRPE